MEHSGRLRMCVCTSGSGCRTAEIDRTMYINYNRKNKNLKKKKKKKHIAQDNKKRLLLEFKELLIAVSCCQLSCRNLQAWPSLLVQRQGHQPCWPLEAQVPSPDAGPAPGPPGKSLLASPPSSSLPTPSQLLPQPTPGGAAGHSGPQRPFQSFLTTPRSL